MAAPTFIGSGVSAENTGSISLALHASTTTGDFLLAEITDANQPRATITGWNKVIDPFPGLGTPGAIGGIGLSLWWKFAGAAEGPMSYPDSGDFQAGQIHTFRGVDPTTPIHAAVKDTDATLQNLIVFPDITTTINDCMIVAAIAIDRDINSTNTQFRDTFTLNGAAMTKIADEGTSANTGGCFGAACGVAATAGTYGADGQLGGSNTYEQVRIVVALAPVSSGGSQTLSPSLLTNTSSLFAPTLTPGAVSLAPSLLSNNNSLFAPTLAPGAVTLSPPLLSNSSTLFGPTITGGQISLLPSLLTNTQTFFGPALAPGTVTIAPSLLTNTQTFFSPTLQPGTVILQPTLLTNIQTYFPFTITSGAVTIQPPLLVNTSVLFAPTISAVLDVDIYPSLLLNAQVFYSPWVRNVRASTVARPAITGHSQRVTPQVNWRLPSVSRRRR